MKELKAIIESGLSYEDKDLAIFNLFNDMESTIELDGVDFYEDEYGDEGIMAMWLRYETNEIFTVEIDRYYRIFVTKTTMPEKTPEQKEQGYSLRHPSPTCRASLCIEKQVTFDQMKQWVSDL